MFAHENPPGSRHPCALCTGCVLLCVRDREGRGRSVEPKVVKMWFVDLSKFRNHFQTSKPPIKATSIGGRLTIGFVLFGGGSRLPCLQEERNELSSHNEVHSYKALHTC